jgi:hypothetical protein
VFPDTSPEVKRGVLRWRGHLQPTWVCKSYLIDIEYRIGWIARVRVITPSLTDGIDRPLPHVYIGGYLDGALCLHLDVDWRPHMPLINTIIPWTVEWLFFYEIWRFTDEWYGTGEWPPRRHSSASAA